jgi:hypothetical protein
VTAHRLHWREDNQRTMDGWTPAHLPTPQGPQVFYEKPPAGPWLQDDQVVLSLPYAAWQALGGPVEITVVLSDLPVSMLRPVDFALDDDR